MTQFWSRLSMFWRFQLAGWAAFIVATFPLKVELTSGVPVALFLVLIRDGSSFLLTLALAVFYRRFWSEKASQMAALIITGCIVAGVLQNGLFYLLRDLVPMTSEIFWNRSMIFSVFYERTGLLFAWSFLYFGVRHFTDGIQKRLQLALLEIQMLRAQMNPHFLFNALNTLKATIETSPQQSKEVIQALTEYLRYSLETRDQKFVPLGKELDVIRHYLTVEKNRFPDVDFDCRIEEATRNLLVPGIAIQPLIENAIKYGRMTSSKPLLIRLITSQPKPHLLRIEVSNTGYWVDQAHHRPEGGIGMENLRRRLALLYPQPPEFRILKPEGWVTVEVDLPTNYEITGTQSPYC